jgi:hypothetical protein
MKKIFSTLISLAVLLLPIVALAQLPPESCTMKRTITLKEFTCSQGESISLDSTKAICCILHTVYNITDWIFVILVGLSTIFVIYGGVNIVFSGGVPENVKAGRDRIMYAMIGLAVGLLAKAVPSIVKLITGA